MRCSWRERRFQELGPRENSTAPFGLLVSADIEAGYIDARSGLRVGPSQLSFLLPMSIMASLPLPQEFVG